MLKQSLVVTDPVGTCKSGADTMLHRTDYSIHLSDNSLRVELNGIISNYIQIINSKGWQANMLDTTYEWRKRIEAVDELGRLRAVRDFEIIEYWEGEI